MSSESKNHHVAWADRIGLNKTWAKAIERIWAAYGTRDYNNAVWGMHTVLINIKNGPQLRQLTDKYTAKLNKDKQKKLLSHYDTSSYDSENAILDDEMLPYLANFMIQLLEDHGFGFYESSVDEDEMH